MNQPSSMKPHTPLLHRILPLWETASVPEALFALALLAAPMAIGGVHTPTRLALAVVAFTAFGWTAWRVTRRGAKMRLGLFGLALLVAAAWAFLQWLPLPTGLVETLSAASVQARRLAAEAVGATPPAWQPLTLDAGRTALAVVSMVGLLAMFLTALNLRTDASLRDRLIVYVEAAAVAVLVVGVLHRLLGLETIFGVYRASVSLAERPLITPFVNPNHAGALMLLGALVAVGRWLTAGREGRHHLPVAAALSVGVVASLSRANTTLFALGLLVIGANLFLRRRRVERQTRTRYLRLVFGVAAATVITVIFVGPERWLGELMTIGDLEAGDMGLARVCWATGGAVFGSHVGFGTGAGAFAVAAPSAMPGWEAGLVSYAHNGVLQVAAELGAPAAAVVLGLVGLGIFFLLRRSWAHPERFALVVALALVAVQNMVDFSLWLPGVAVPFVALLGVAVGETWPQTRRAKLAWRWPFAATVALGGVLAVTALYGWDERPGAWQGQMRAEIEAGKPGRVDLQQTLVRHAHDYYAFRLGSAVARRKGDLPLSARLLERAGQLAPGEPDTLAARARVALQAGEVDAGLATLEALASQGPEASKRATRLVLDSRDQPEVLAAWFDPRARLGAQAGAQAGAERVRRAAEELDRRGESPASEGLLRWGVERYPEALVLYERLGARWSGMAQRADELDRLSVALLSRAGSAPKDEQDGWARAGYLLQGHVQLRDGNALEAWHLYLEAAELDPGRAAQALIAAGRAALRLGRIEQLDEVLRRLDEVALSGVWERGQARWLRSREREARGDIDGAIRQMQHAVRHLDLVPGYHDRLGKLFDLTGDPTSAARARRRAEEIREAAKNKRELELR